MCSPRRQCAQCYQAFILQGLFTSLGQPSISLPQVVRQADDDDSDKAGAHDKAEPHTEYMHLKAAIMMHTVVGQGYVIKEQAGITGDRQGGHEPGITARQNGGGNDQWQQIEPDERVGCATGEIKQAGDSGDIQQHLHENLRVADDDAGLESQPRQQVKDSQQRQGDYQRLQRQAEFEIGVGSYNTGAGAQYGDIAQQEQPPQDPAGHFILRFNVSIFHALIMQW